MRTERCEHTTHKNTRKMQHDSMFSVTKCQLIRANIKMACLYTGVLSHQWRVQVYSQNMRRELLQHTNALENTLPDARSEHSSGNANFPASAMLLLRIGPRNKFENYLKCVLCRVVHFTTQRIFIFVFIFVGCRYRGLPSR